MHWLRVVLDEAHTIRNHKAKQSEAACALKADRRWAHAAARRGAVHGGGARGRCRGGAARGRSCMHTWPGQIVMQRACTPPQVGPERHAHPEQPQRHLRRRAVPGACARLLAGSVACCAGWLAHGTAWPGTPVIAIALAWLVGTRRSMCTCAARRFCAVHECRQRLSPATCHVQHSIHTCGAATRAAAPVCAGPPAARGEAAVHDPAGEARAQWRGGGHQAAAGGAIERAWALQAAGMGAAGCGNVPIWLGPLGSAHVP